MIEPAPPPVAAAQQRGGAPWRLTGAGAFEAVFRDGTRSHGAWLQVVFAPATQVFGRVGLIIGRRMLRRAVDRSRLRRMLREAARAARPGIEPYDVIVRLKEPCTRAELRSIANEAATLLGALGNPSAHERR